MEFALMFSRGYCQNVLIYLLYLRVVVHLSSVADVSVAVSQSVISRILVYATVETFVV